MENKIDKHLNKIEESILWINANLSGEKKKIAYNALVNCRRKLNKIKLAISENPAAAMFGESQMGKSYLVSGLLSTEEAPFNVIDQTGNKYDFIKSINPIGNEQESTSLVTRFTLYSDVINSEFPIKVKLLSIKDIVLLLCDTYYNDVKAHNFIKADELEREIIKAEKNKAESTSLQEIVSEDDILEIRDYFETHFKSKAPYLEDSSFFEKISVLISKLEPNEWESVFSLLWNKNKNITETFIKLLNKYKEFDFVNEIYIPYKAVLREYGTLLDVSRLYEITNKASSQQTNFEPETAVFYTDRNGKNVEKTVYKSYLCAMASELVFALPQELKDSKLFLEKTDLLDFPGARARMENYENDINDDLIPQMLLRGKVAYLFNKYSDNYKINALLFCHGKRMSSQRLIPEVLNRWISSFVGESPEIRQEFINASHLPPLFIICTMFNLDLKIGLHDKEGDTDSLINRWSQRFNTVLENEIINIETYDWFYNWTTNQSNFQNLYLLRDFYFSSEEQNNLFTGFIENGIETEDVVPVGYPKFREDLKKSFINFDFVKKHFASPERSWDKAALKNEDGTKLIIENLSLIVANINKARNKKFTNILDQISAEVLVELEKHYHSKDSDELLLKAKKTAGSFQLKLDLAFAKDPYYFGKLMQKFTISEGHIYNLYRDKLFGEKKDLDEYIAIRINTPELNIGADFLSNLESLRKKYDYPTVDITQQEFEEKGIDLDELFYGKKKRIMNFSKTLAEELEREWFENFFKADTNSKLREVFSEDDISTIIGMLKKLYNKLHLSDMISESIRKYVDRFDNVEMAQEMMADISAEIINKFINSVGFDYYSEENKSDLRIANSKNNLGLEIDHDYLDHEKFNSENVKEMFDVYDNLPQLLNSNPIDQEILKYVPGMSNYKKWRDLLKFGFISVCDIPTYDIQANEKLAILKSECGEFYYGLDKER